MNGVRCEENIKYTFLANLCQLEESMNELQKAEGIGTKFQEKKFIRKKTVYIN